MTDEVFGELRQYDGYRWLQGEWTLDFGGKPCTVELLIYEGEEGEITAEQKTAFQCFMEKWPKLQENLIEALLKYYNEQERFSYGPDDKEELAKWWPEIETKEALLQAVTLEAIVVARESTMKRWGRTIYLLFSRVWGGEDWDDNGIGVRCVNEEIDEIAYKDMAY